MVKSHVGNLIFVAPPHLLASMSINLFLSNWSLKMAAAPQPFTAPTPLNTLQEHGSIRFLHPGYPAPTNLLLILPRVDPLALASETTTTTFGVHYLTALVACQIIANNAFANGRLTLDPAGQQLVDLPRDGILTEDLYYFIVGDSPGR